MLKMYVCAAVHESQLYLTVKLSCKWQQLHTSMCTYMVKPSMLLSDRAASMLAAAHCRHLQILYQIKTNITCLMCQKINALNKYT